MESVKKEKVVILCGGKGTRFREETEFRPKPMVEIGHKPILWHIMKIFSFYGFNDFVLFTASIATSTHRTSLSVSLRPKIS